MEWKVKQAFAPQLFNDKDRNELLRMPKKDVDTVVEYFKSLLSLSPEYILDYKVCPWCVLYMESYECNGCLFKKRHKVCWDDNSDYTTAVGEGSLCEKIGRQEVLSKLIELFGGK